MNTILFLILAVIVVVVAAFLFKGTNFSNRVRQIGGAINDGLAESDSDGAFAIKDAQEEVNRFRQDITGLVAANNGLERRRAAAVAEVTKFNTIMRKAAEAGDAEGAREAQVLRNKAQANVDSLNKQIAVNEGLEDKLKEQLRDYQRKIEAATDDHARLVVSEKSAKLRQAVAERAAGLGSGKGLAALDKLAERAELAELNAEAYEELAATTTTGQGEALEAKYSGTSQADEDELTALLNKNPQA